MTDVIMYWTDPKTLFIFHPCSLRYWKIIVQFLSLHARFHHLPREIPWSPEIFAGSLKIRDEHGRPQIVYDELTRFRATREKLVPRISSRNNGNDLQ